MPPITLTPRDAAFKQALIDAKYYPHDHGCSNNNRPLPNNLDEIHERLHERRPSLSQSRFTDDDFQHFKDLNESALTQAHAMSRIFPIIRGREAVASGQGYLFGNMDPLAENISRAIPGYFNGSYPENVRGEVRADLKMYIVPSSNDSRPLLPNFFSEVGTNPSMMERRITQVLGYGARSMYKIQSYRQGQSVFDGNAYTIGSTYSYGENAGILRLYTMHPTGPAGPNGEPKYWTNEIMTFAMTKDADAFRNGAARFKRLGTENTSIVVNRWERKKAPSVGMDIWQDLGLNQPIHLGNHVYAVLVSSYDVEITRTHYLCISTNQHLGM